MAIDDAAVVQALQVIRDQGCDGINVADVVAQTSCSRSVLERRFRNLIGRSINEELTRVRLNHAVELLSMSQLEPKQIAAKAGFGSVSYMCTVFQKKLRRTPGSFRKAKPRQANGRTSRPNRPAYGNSRPATARVDSHHHNAWRSRSA